MKTFAIGTVLRKAAKEYTRHLALYMGVGITITAFGWLGHVLTSYFSQRCGYDVLRPLSFDSLGDILLFIGKMVETHPFWLMGMVIVMAGAKVVELLGQCILYALALQVSSGNEITRISLLFILKRVGTIAVRYIAATMLYGTIISILFGVMSAPWSFIPSLPFSPAVTLPVAIMGTVIGLYLPLWAIAHFYFYPYFLLDKNMSAWQSLKSSKAMVGSHWKKVVVVAVLLFLPLMGIWFGSLYYTSKWMVSAHVSGFFSVGIVASYTSLVMAHIYRVLR